MKAAARQLNEKSVKTRIAAFNCLRQLATTLPGCLCDHAAIVIPGVERALKDASSNALRIETLLFLLEALRSHPPATFQTYVGQLLSPITLLADDRYYKMVAEALRVLAEFVKLLRPEPPEVTFAHDVHVPRLYNVVERRLQANDQDQEVKECAISCMGLLIAHLADHPCIEHTKVLHLLLERMRNETTRITTVKTFALIAGAKLDVQLSTVVAGGTVLELAVAELCAFLRKSSRPLRQASLITLEVIISRYAAALPDSHVTNAMSELSGLVNDGDLHVAHLALTLAQTMITSTKRASVTDPLSQLLIPKVLILLHSTLLQGVALKSLLSLLSQIVAEQYRKGSNTVIALWKGWPYQCCISLLAGYLRLPLTICGSDCSAYPSLRPSLVMPWPPSRKPSQLAVQLRPRNKPLRALRSLPRTS